MVIHARAAFGWRRISASNLSRGERSNSLIGTGSTASWLAAGGHAASGHAASGHAASGRTAVFQQWYSQMVIR